MNNGLAHIRLTLATQCTVTKGHTNPVARPQSGQAVLQHSESRAIKTVEGDFASADGQHQRQARSANRIAVAPCSAGVVIVQRDAAQTSTREESELRWAREKVNNLGDMLGIWSMLESQRYPHVGTVDQHIGEACYRTRHRRAQPVVSVTAQHLGDLSGGGLGPATGKCVDSAINAAVPKATDHKAPETIGKIANQMRSNRFDIPPTAQTRCCQLIGSKTVDHHGDRPSLVCHCREYPFAFPLAEPHKCRISGKTWDQWGPAGSVVRCASWKTLPNGSRTMARRSPYGVSNGASMDTAPAARAQP